MAENYKAELSTSPQETMVEIYAPQIIEEGEIVGDITPVSLAQAGYENHPRDTVHSGLSSLAFNLSRSLGRKVNISIEVEN